MSCEHTWCTNGDWEYCSRCSVNRKAEPAVIAGACGHWWNTDCGEHDICRLCGALRKNHSHQHQFSGDRVQATLDRIERQQATLLFNLYSGETRLMSTVQELTQALKDFGGQIQTNEDAHKATDAAFQAKITDLLSNGALDQQALKDAFDALAADRALIPAPAVPVADPIPVVDAGTVSETPAS